jgi:uncharacterized membrane protein
LRYLLAIAGLLAAALVALMVWMALPRTAPVPAAGGEAKAQQQQNAPGTEASASSDAGGEFRVCNETGNKISVAFGYRADKGWQSEGWWVADPSSCVTVYRGDLGARRYYYLYAADDVGGGAWDGTVYMCTRDETFTIFGVEDCLARGYERTGFFEVDTHNKSNWTVQLTEGAASGGEDAGATDQTIPLEGDMPDSAGDQGAPPDNSIDEGTDTE